MLKRLLDLVGGAAGLAVSLPLIAVAALAVWLQDGKPPIYVSSRIGQHGLAFKVWKLRTMAVGADKAGRHTISSDDPNVTALGRLLRKYKIDELLQFGHVLAGQMSLVGPRPNVKAAVDRYTPEELRILSVKPGITDFASIVFSDLDELMAGSADVNAAYDTRIRPWKSRLSLFYVDHHNMSMDVLLLWYTARNIINRQAALEGVSALLRRHGASAELADFALRKGAVPEATPPGA